MKLGFTGTRHGMSPQQIRLFEEFLRFRPPSEFHDGDCEGADREARAIVERVCPDCKFIQHPGAPGSYLKRNREIVDSSDALVAAPLQDEPQQRGGTWYTISYAEKRNKPVAKLRR